MKRAASIIILLSLLAVIPAPVILAQAPSGNRTIDVIGTGRIHGEDISGARDQAISDCLVTAISRVAADLLQQQVLVQSFQDINRLLFSGADRFVQDYKVLTEDTTGRVYRVMVQTTVSVEKIREILLQNDILSRNATPLKVLLLIAEQNLEDLSYRYWWDGTDSETLSEEPFAAALSEQGLVVLRRARPAPDTDTPDTLAEIPLPSEMSNGPDDTPVERGSDVDDPDLSWPEVEAPDALVDTSLESEASDRRDPAPAEQSPAVANDLPSSIVDGSNLMMEAPPGPEMSNEAAAAFGSRFLADVVVAGTATVRKASNILGNELRSFEGSLSVRAIRTDTGVVLTELNHKFIAAEADDLAGSYRALTEAGAQTGELLAGKITSAWQQTVEKGPIAATIVVEGNYKLSHLVAFRRTLSGLSGVYNLQTRGMTPEVTTLSLDYDGTTQGLAETLLLNAFEGFGVHITEASSEAIRLSLVSD